MSVPARPQIFHIVHVDKLASIIADGRLWCDAEVAKREIPGTTIGMQSIKQRRLEERTLTSHPSLYVGACVPFYFCPRSIMLYLMHKANHEELAYRGGQEPVLHLESNAIDTIEWAEKNDFRWAFTLSNAAAYYAEDRAELSKLAELDWNAIRARDWRDCKEEKQAEFLVEREFPWTLVSRIGVKTKRVYGLVSAALEASKHKPRIEIKGDWYY